jgi:hypothetical protein
MPVRIILLKAATVLYQLTGISLLKSSIEHPVPLEQSFGGEVGIFYFVPIISTYCKLSVFDAAWWFLFMQIIIGVFVAGTALLSIARSLLGQAIVVIGVGLLGYVAWLVSDVYVAYFFTVSFFPWLLVLLEKKYYKTLLPYSFLLGLIIEYGNFVRSFSGLPLLVGSFVSIVCCLRFSRKTVLSLAFLALGVGVVKLHIHRVIKQRDAYLQHHGYVFKKETLQHTFWHNVYMGFGFITNNKDIDFSDYCSVKKAKTINPKVGYLQPQYEPILRNEIIKLCLHSPNYVLRVLFAKLGVLFYYLLLFANVGLLAAYYYPKPLYIDLSYWSMLCISSLPGILTIPNTLYLLGFISIAALYGIHSIVYALNVQKRVKNN